MTLGAASATPCWVNCLMTPSTPQQFTSLFMHEFIQTENTRGRLPLLNGPEPRLRRLRGVQPQRPEMSSQAASSWLRRIQRTRGKRRGQGGAPVGRRGLRPERGVASGQGAEPEAWLGPEVDNLEQGPAPAVPVFRGPLSTGGSGKGMGPQARPSTHKRSSRTCQSCCRPLHPRLQRADGQRGWRPVSRGPCREAGRWRGREPGSEGGAALAPHFALAACPHLPGGGVPVPRAAAVGEEADAAQDGKQAGAPAQVEGRAQLVPGDEDGEQVALARESHRDPPAVPHTHLVPAYKGSKKSLVMLKAYQETATIPQIPGGGTGETS